jgi:hypothetical protein
MSVNAPSVGRPTTARVSEEGNAQGAWHGSPPAPRDGVDPAPVSVPSTPPSGVTNEQIRDKGNTQAQEMRDWQWLMMDLQHQQAKNSLIATAASAISSDAARTAKDIAGRIG